MPFLADIDQPPRSRTPGMLFGLALAFPLVIGLGWLIAWGVHTIVGGANEHDARLRVIDGYLEELCRGAEMSPERDGELCGCASAMEYPSMDCRHLFTPWILARQREACEDNAQDAVSFCVCVETVAQRVEEAGASGEGRREAMAYEGCAALDDALPLPPLADPSAP